MTDLELLRAFGLICEDPECTATHVDIDSVPTLVFRESQ